MSIKLEDALEISLQSLQAGVSLDDILVAAGEQAEELEPLLETAEAAVQLAAVVHISRSAQNRSRAQFLSAAAAPAPAAPRWRFSFFHLRLATASLILAGILAISLLGTGLASAAALPGDVFYPVKRMVENIQINFVQDPPARLELEENLDDRRLEEATNLGKINRREFVTFSGVLSLSAQDRWQVGHLLLVFSPDASPAPMLGYFVQVSGYSDSTLVEVTEIQLRSYLWDGVIQKIEAGTWWVGGVQVMIDEDSRVSGADPLVGAMVHVTAVRLSDNRFLALSLQVSPLPAATATRSVKIQATATRAATKAPTARPTRTEMETVKKSEAPEPSRTPTPQAKKSSTAPARTGTKTPEKDADSATRAPAPTRTPTPQDDHD